MFTRWLSLLALTATLAGAQGIFDKEERKETPPEVQAERDANRSQIEVEGVMYPVYLYDEEAKPKKRAKVAIPKKAKREGRGGIVLLGTLIDESGEVASMTIAMSNAEPDIQEAVMTAVAQWLFPIKRDQADQPFPYAVMVPVTVDSTPFFGPKGKRF
jgi:TonB family protein